MRRLAGNCALFPLRRLASQRGLFPPQRTPPQTLNEISISGTIVEVPASFWQPTLKIGTNLSSLFFRKRWVLLHVLSRHTTGQLYLLLPNQLDSNNAIARTRICSWPLRAGT